MNWPSRPLRAWPARPQDERQGLFPMPTSPKAPADPIDARLVRRLADILTETGLSEIEVEHAGLKIRVAKQLAAPAQVTYAAPVAAAPAPAAAAAPAAGAPAAEAAVRGDAVKSPM